MFYVDLSADLPAVKRGDIMRTNIGDKRERTWIVLRAIQRRTARRCFNVWAARWWELEPEMRMRLFRSAQRNGGQNVVTFYRYPVKKKARAKWEWSQ
jgi:hypothetical protein